MELFLPLEWKCGFGKSMKGDWDVKVMEDFLKLHSSFVNKVINGKTLLLIALTDKRCPFDVIKVLLRYGADVNVTDQYGSSPLALGLLHGASKDVIELLLDAGCSLASSDHFHSVLHCALEGEALQKDVLHLLIERGADVNAVDVCGGSTIMCCALQQHLSASFIEILYEAGASLSACTGHGHPLLCATSKSMLRPFLPTNLVEWLLLKAAPFRQIDTSIFGTPLQRALSGCTYEAGAIHLLLQHFPDVNIVDKLDNNLLHYALDYNFRFRDLATIKLLIKRGVCVDGVNKFGETPLHLAAANPLCSWRIIELLLKSGAAVNARDGEGQTPLEKMVGNRYYPSRREIDDFTIDVLLSAGAHVEFVKNGHSILHRVLEKYIQFKNPKDKDVLYRHFKLLFQYNLLENPNFNIQEMINFHKSYKTYLKYWEVCVIELKQMESVMVNKSCTLREFLISYFTPSNEATDCRPQLEKYDCDQLLRIKANKVFPLFSGIISDKVDRWFMVAKLPELQLYTMKWSPHKACQEEKVLLPCEVVRKIVQYLVDDDLLSFIVALTYMDGHACSNSQENLIGGKKVSSKELTHCPKKLNVASKCSLQ